MGEGVSVNRAQTLCTDQNKAKFFESLIGKYLNTLAASRRLGVCVRIAQIWARHCEKYPDGVSEEREKNGSCAYPQCGT